MDFTTFDTISRTVATSQTRRSALRGLVAGAATLVAGGVLLHAEDTSAKRRKRGKGKGKGKGLQPGQRCQNDTQCTKGYICEVPVNGSNSDEYCSGGQGAGCGAPNGDGDDTFPFCAVGFACTPTGNTYTCQAVEVIDIER
ncbi:MAG: hypothetical protein U0075_07665 [Thermomicrobiales bacterium]